MTDVVKYPAPFKSLKGYVHTGAVRVIKVDPSNIVPYEPPVRRVEKRSKKSVVSLEKKKQKTKRVASDKVVRDPATPSRRK